VLYRVESTDILQATVIRFSTHMSILWHCVWLE